VVLGVLALQIYPADHAAIPVLDAVISTGVALDLPGPLEGLKYPVPFVSHDWTLATLSAKIKS
jgi:hypothetical protein